MAELVVKLPTPHDKQREIERLAKRFNLLRAGRRFGKDIEMQRRIVTLALNNRQPCAWYAPTYRMLKENFRDMRNILAPVSRRASESELRIELITGNPIEFWSLDNPDSSRGRHYKHIVVNEAALVQDLVDVWDLVLRPTLMDLHGSADFGSTPRGLNGFFTLWQRAADDKEWARFHYSTYDNPHIDPEEIEALRKALPERAFKQEIDANFVENGSYFQNVDSAAVVEACDVPENHRGHTIFAGLDWAMHEDFTVLTLTCAECNRTVAWDRFNQIDYSYQRERIYNFCAPWKIMGILPERNSIGEPNMEILDQMGMPVLEGMDGKMGFNTTSASKPILIQHLAAGLEHEGFLAPLDYADELRIFEAEPGIHIKFSAPSGQHDDRVISLALAWYAMTKIYTPFGGIHL